MLSGLRHGIIAEVTIRVEDYATTATHINNVRNAHGLSDVPASFLDNTYVSLVGGGADLSMENLAFSDFKIDGALGYLIEELNETLWMQGTRLWTRQDLVFGIKILRHHGTMSEFLRVKQASIRSLQECQEINKCN